MDRMIDLLSGRRLEELEHDEAVRIIADYYGPEAQARQLIEEMGELTVALNKFWRYEHGFIPSNDAERYSGDIIEEIADVRIMLEQIAYLYGIMDSTINRTMQRKIDRQLRRIANSMARAEGGGENE